MAFEQEPNPRDLDEDIARTFTDLIAAHTDFVYENQPLPDLTGQQLLLRSHSGRFYRVLRVTRLSDEGVKAMDTLEITTEGGDRFLHKQVVQYIRREFSDTDIFDDIGKLIIATRKSPEDDESTYEKMNLDAYTLDQLLLELGASEPMVYQLPH